MATAVKEISTLEESEELKKDVTDTVVDECKENKGEEMKKNDTKDEEVKMNITDDEEVKMNITDDEEMKKNDMEDEEFKEKNTEDDEVKKNDTEDEKMKEKKNAVVDEVEKNKNEEAKESGNTDKTEEEESRETLAPDTQWGGKRRRKSVEQFRSFPVQPVAKEIEVGTGRGVALGDIPFVQEMLDKHSCEELKPLHKILYNNTVGNKAGIKQRIRKFNGYPFTADDSKPFNSIHGRITKIKASEKKLILKVMGMNVTSKVDDLLDFLMEPQDKGKKVVSKRTPKKPTKPKTRKRKSSSSKTPVSKKQKVSQIYSDSEDSSDVSDTKDEEEGEKEESEPSKCPSDNEIRGKVKDVVGALDLDTISMKQAVSKIFECYPNVDLGEKKQFIKDQIKELLD